MRPNALVAGFASALLACGCSSKANPDPVAGLYALEGAGTVARAGFSTRSARAGTALTGDSVLKLEGRAVLEGFNGRLVALGRGEHPVGSLRALKAEAVETRRVHVLVGGTSETKDLPALIVQTRYEPVESGRALPKPSDESLADNAKVFFTPGGLKGEVDDARPRGAPPPWMRDAFVHGLRRPLGQGDGARTLVAADGAVVVEFRDKATAFSSALKLPLDLGEVERVVVVQGSARLALPEGRSLVLGEGDAVEVR